MAVQDDLKELLALIPGGANVNRKLAEFEAYIRAQAKAGAEEAIPTIKASIEPYILGSLLVGGLGLGLGFIAYKRTQHLPFKW